MEMIYYEDRLLTKTKGECIYMDGQTVTEVTEVVDEATLGELIELAKHQLENLLNPSALTLDSVEGVLVLILILFMLHSFSEKMFKVASWCLAGILIIQIGYYLSFTGLNDFIPFSSIFKYDIMTSLAQLCVGTKLSDIILYASAVLQTILNAAAGYLAEWIGIFIDYLKNVDTSVFDHILP